MKLAPYVEKLNASSEFKDFKKKYNNSFMAAGFFVIDFESGKNLHQIDYYVPTEKKIAAFTLDGKITLQLLETMNEKVPEQLDIKTNVDLDALAGILQDEMKNRNITENIKKIIAVIQNIEGKKIWNLNCVLSGMEILKAHVEDESRSVLKMERLSVMDYVQKIPTSALKQMQNPKNQQNVKDQIEQLNKLEKEIEKEKLELVKSMDKKDTTKKAKTVKANNKPSNQ